MTIMVAPSFATAVTNRAGSSASTIRSSTVYPADRSSKNALPRSSATRLASPDRKTSGTGLWTTVNGTAIWAATAEAVAITSGARLSRSTAQITGRCCRSDVSNVGGLLIKVSFVERV